jgi:hypothetical protein
LEQFADIGASEPSPKPIDLPMMNFVHSNNQEKDQESLTEVQTLNENSEIIIPEDISKESYITQQDNQVPTPASTSDREKKSTEENLERALDDEDSQQSRP